VKIVGVGAGPRMLTERAIEAVKTARRVYGSARALKLADEYIRGERIILEKYDVQIEDDACILSTGDPMLSGLGNKAPPDAEIIPGISSLQLACARLKVDATDLIAITIHGRAQRESKEKLHRILRFKEDLFILTDPSFDVSDICGYLDVLGYDGEVIVLEDLGYETETVSFGRVVSPPERQSDLFCMVIRNLAKKKKS
jgi:cobalt-precorrin-7 (C5)-methyltransferase